MPTDPAAVDAYLVRLDAVGRAMTMAQDAYASALSERDELRRTLGAYAAKAGRPARPSPGSAQADADLAELQRRAGDALDREPADLVRGRALVAAYVAYLASATGSRSTRPAGGEALMSTTACAQPGCTGAILDGYCDVCGSPGPAGRLRLPAATPAALLRPAP